MKRMYLSFIPVLLLLTYQLSYSQAVEVLQGQDIKVKLDPNNSSNGGEIRLYDDDGTITTILAGAHGNQEGSYLNLYTGSGANTIQLDAHHNAGGQFFLRNANGQLALHAQANTGVGFNSSYGVLDLHDNAGTRRISLGAQQGLFGTSIMAVYESDGSVATSMGRGLATGGFLNIMNANGTAIIQMNGAPLNEDYHLSVDGRIISEELRISLSQNWPDYVFNTDYELTSLDDLSTNIKELGHLPKIPSAQEIEASGIDAGEMLKRQMEKIEELTLYILELHERIKNLENKD